VIVPDEPVPVAVAIDSNEDGTSGVNEADAEEAVDVPAEFVAVTVKV
jgi:hypothetical protein